MEDKLGRNIRAAKGMASQVCDGGCCDCKTCANRPACEWVAECGPDNGWSKWSKAEKLPVFPSENKAIFVEVFSIHYHPKWIVGASGAVTRDCFTAIEKQIEEDDNDQFNLGDGAYLLNATWDDGQYDEEGRCEILPYWILDHVSFKALEGGESMKAEE